MNSPNSEQAEEHDPTQRPGRPRNEEAHHKILTAARKLAGTLAYGDITITAISSEAKVAKTTIYRWWKDKPHLVFEAIYDRPWRCPNTGNLESDLEELLEQYLSNHQGTHFHKVQQGLWADLAEKGLQKGAAPSLHLQNFCKVLQTVMDRARKRGELSWKPDACLLQMALMGSVHQSVFDCKLPHTHSGPETPKLQNLVHLLVHGIHTPPSK